MTAIRPEPLAPVVQCLASSPAVAAVALVGSHASGAAEPDADFDLFVYADGDLDELRARMADRLADPAEWQSIRDGAFGDGDVWRLRDGGGWLDLMYWSRSWAAAPRLTPPCGPIDLLYSPGHERSTGDARDRGLARRHAHHALREW